MPRPLPLTVATVLLALEGAVVVVLAVLELVHLTPGRVTMGVTTTVFLGAYGVGLLLCAWGLWRRRAWGRGPGVLAQLIQLGLAWNFRAEATEAVAAVLAVVSVVALVALFARSTTLALEREGY